MAAASCLKRYGLVASLVAGLLLLVVLLSSSDSSAHQNLSKAANSLDMYTVTNPDAMCNDNSPAIYYFKAGLEDKWVIEIDGGGSCHDQASCDARRFEDPTKMSSSFSESTFTGGGIIGTSPSSNPFSSWSHVHVHYCSSDLFSGTAKIDESGLGWSFLGSINLMATLDDLNTVHGMDKAKTVVVAGRSAGATATFAMATSIADKIKEFASSASLKFVIDSGWLPDMDPYENGADCSEEACPPKDTVPIAEEFWKPAVGTSCANAHRNDLWKCYYGTYSVPYIIQKGQVFVAQDWTSWADFVRLGLPKEPTTSAEKAYAQTVADTMMSEVEKSGAHALMSAACGVTGIVSFDNWEDYCVDGYCMPTAVSEWVDGTVSSAAMSKNSDPNADDAPIHAAASIYWWVDYCDNEHGDFFCSEECPAQTGKAK